MKVLVSGSLRYVEEAQKEPIKAAARELGKALAMRGHTLLVGDDDPTDIDPYVVEGFLDDTKTGDAEVHLQKGAPPSYQNQARVKPQWHRYADWDVTVLEVVREDADAVIIVAGGKGVIQAGIAGWMLGRPTIPFAGFGGGAATVWDYGSSDRERFYFRALRDREIDQLNSPWESGRTGALIVKYLDQCAAFARRAAVSPTLQFSVTLSILIALVAWVLFLAVPLLGWAGIEAAVKAGEPAPPDFSGGVRFLLLLGAVCSAGAFGALVQSMRSIRDGMATTGRKVSTDAVLGVAAGFLTAALYMLAQIAINGTLEVPKGDANYSRVALIVSMAAVFASLYLDAAFSRFDGLKESVMAGNYGKTS